MPPARPSSGHGPGRRADGSSRAKPARQRPPRPLLANRAAVSSASRSCFKVYRKGVPSARHRLPVREARPVHFLTGTSMRTPVPARFRPDHHPSKLWAAPTATMKVTVSCYLLRVLSRHQPTAGTTHNSDNSSAVRYRQQFDITVQYHAQSSVTARSITISNRKRRAVSLDRALHFKPQRAAKPH